VWLADRLRGARQPAVLCVLREFLCRFVLIYHVGGFWSAGPFFKVRYWRFGVLFWTVRP
jgi:hypothetical protein